MHVGWMYILIMNKLESSFRSKKQWYDSFDAGDVYEIAE